MKETIADIKNIADGIDSFLGSREGPLLCDSVRLDLEKWFPKMIDGGIIVFHDRQWHGVKEVVKESVLRSRNFRNVRVVKNTSMVLAEKTARNSVIDVLKNRCLILLVNLDLRTRVRRLKKMFRNHEK